MFGRLRSTSRWRPGALAKGSIAMSAAIGARVLIQGLLFLIIARVLGIDRYGAYAAVLALAMAIGTLGGLGVGGVMVRDVSRDSRRFAREWGSALMAVALTSPLLFALYLALAWLLIPPSVPFTVTLFIGLSEIALTPLVIIAIQAFQGHERITRAAWLYLIPVLPRFIGALALIPIVRAAPDAPALTTWSLLYFIATLLTVAICLHWVRRDLGHAEFGPLPPLRGKLREGFPFAIGTAAQKLYADIDKTMLARLSTLEATGAYSASYRVVDLATIPAQSLLLAAGPRFFREGKGGTEQALAFARAILPIPLALTLVACAALYWGAELLPWLLGESYQAAIPALRWLAWLPCLTLFRLLLQALLIGSDRHRGAVAALLFGSGLNILLNLMLIPTLGWEGAIIATYCAEAAMIVAMGLITRHSLKDSGAK